MLQPKKLISKKKSFVLQNEKNLVQRDNIPNTKRDLSLMLAEYNNAKKDEQELRTTGQIKNPNSIQYKRNIKAQPRITPEDYVSVTGFSNDNVDKLFDDLSFKFDDKEEKLIKRDVKNERDISFYNFLKEKTKDKEYKEEYLKAIGNVSFETFTDQLPQIAEKYRGNPYVDKMLKLPHINKIKALKDFVYDGRPLTALSDLLKIPKFSNKYIDFFINAAQENPSGFDIKTIEDKMISPVRLAGLKNQQVITDIGREILNSGETPNSKWYLKEYNLPTVLEVPKVTGIGDTNDFVEFVENYKVGRNKTYKNTIDAYKKFYGSQKKNTEQEPKQFQQGGYINQNTNMTRYAQGGDLTRLDEGGLHHQNPLGGVPMGNGNTVEQGETIKNDFVYSNRITLTPEIIKQYNLPTSLANKTVADATKFIDNKFKDRTDKISMSTKNGMLSKIAEAQEAMKPIESTQSIEPGNTLGQNQMFLGGEMENEGGVPGLQQGLGALTSLASGDKEGAISEGLSAVGSIGGTAIGGPIGGMIGGAIGGIAGNLINGVGQRKEARELAKQQHVIGSNKFSNDFAYGGKMYSGGGPIVPDYIKKNALDFQNFALSKDKNALPKFGADNSWGAESDAAYNKYGKEYRDFLSNSISDDTQRSLINADLNRKPSTQFGTYNKLSPEAQNGLNITEGVNPETNNFNQAKADEIYKNSKSTGLPKADLSKLGNTLGQAARYAPIAMNAYQLSQLEKPSYSRLNRLDQRFKPEYVDERSLQNIVSNETNNSINALTGAVNGSVGALRNNILGAGLNRTKAMSEAYANAEAQNRATNMQGQQFNAGINAANLQQDNAELDINDRNEAAYRNAKREYLTGIGEGIGDVGKEEIYKQIAVTTTGYNFLGKFMEQNPNATPQQALEAAKKAGVVADNTTTTETKPKALGGYLFKNKRK